MLFHSWGPRRRRSRHLFLTVAVATSTLLVALVVPNISVVFSLMGGTASAYVCYIIPAAAAWKVAGSDAWAVAAAAAGAGRGAEFRIARSGCAAPLLFGVVVGTLSTGTTIAEWFRPGPPPRGACDVLDGGAGVLLPPVAR
jgi:amino acid permease